MVATLPQTLTPIFSAPGSTPAVQHRRAVVPPSAFTTAWGDPAVTLVCGVQTDDLSNGKQCLTNADGRLAIWYRDLFAMTQWNTRVPPYLQVTIPPGSSTLVVGPLASITDSLPDSATMVDDGMCESF